MKRLLIFMIIVSIFWSFVYYFYLKQLIFVSIVTNLFLIWLYLKYYSKLNTGIFKLPSVIFLENLFNLTFSSNKKIWEELNKLSGAELKIDKE